MKKILFLLAFCGFLLNANATTTPSVLRDTTPVLGVNANTFSAATYSDTLKMQVHNQRGTGANANKRVLKQLPVIDVVNRAVSLANYSASQTYKTIGGYNQDTTGNYVKYRAGLTSKTYVDDNINYEYLERMRQDSILNAQKLAKTDFHDNQNLTLVNRRLSIQNGNYIDLPIIDTTTYWKFGGQTLPIALPVIGINTYGTNSNGKWMGLGINSGQIGNNIQSDVIFPIPNTSATIYAHDGFSTISNGVSIANEITGGSGITIKNHNGNDFGQSRQSVLEIGNRAALYEKVYVFKINADTFTNQKIRLEGSQGFAWYHSKDDALYYSNDMDKRWQEGSLGFFDGKVHTYRFNGDVFEYVPLLTKYDAPKNGLEQFNTEIANSPYDFTIQKETSHVQFANENAGEAQSVVNVLLTSTADANSWKTIEFSSTCKSDFQLNFKYDKDDGTGTNITVTIPFVATLDDVFSARMVGERWIVKKL